jgi:chemotaxis protein MotB
VVNLPAQVLFDSGSAELTEDGEAALKEVAKILRTVRNRRFMIGGHTDNQKIVKADFDSNWELASARAIVVTKALIKAGLPPKNLVAAGYSQYAPIASNASDVGRQKNRRIEIILEPFLKDITPPVAARKSKKAKNKTAARKRKKKGKKAVKSS